MANDITIWPEIVSIIWLNGITSNLAVFGLDSHGNEEDKTDDLKSLIFLISKKVFTFKSCVFLMFSCLKAYLNANEHLNQKFLSYPNLHADNRRGLTGGIVMADLFISD